MSWRSRLVAQRELAGSLRARWFIAYLAVFFAGGLLLATLGLQDVTVYGYRGFAKAFAGLVHLALLFVPVMALFPAAAAIAEDRETGALDYVLAQPISPTEVYLGKWAGVSLAVALSVTVGFGVVGAAVVWRGVPVGLVLTLYAFVVLLALVFVALGLCFSTLAGSRGRALTLAVMAWLTLVALGTLGVMIAFIRWGIPENALIAWTFLNPVEAFRLGIVSVLDPDLSLLGPVGAGILSRLGSGGALTVAAMMLSFWAITPGLVGLSVFRRPT